ncbi:MAG: PIG-L family deacetylase [Bacillota bacterium]
MPLKDVLPLLSLENAKRVLCVQPHPDDNELGAGGTIAMLANRGSKITYLTVTDGSAGTQDPTITPEELAKIRYDEASRAARHLGASEFLWLGLRDGDVPEERELVRRILGVIRKARPDAILVPDPWLPYEAHRDHRLTGLATASACILGPFPHVKSDPEAPPHGVSMVGFYCTTRPNTWINVDATWHKKIEAVKMHESQFKQGWAMVSMYLEMKARELAKGRGFVRAEALKVLPPILLHFNVDAEGF